MSFLVVSYFCIYLIPSWTQEKALEQLKVTESKTVAVGQKMDLVFYTLQLGFFYMDFDLISKSIDKAKKWVKMWICPSPLKFPCNSFIETLVINLSSIMPACSKKEVIGKGRTAWRSMRGCITCQLGISRRQPLCSWIPFQHSLHMSSSRMTPLFSIPLSRVSYPWIEFL